MEDLQTILIIGAIINIIVLIVFFVMAGNISAIKNLMKKSLIIKYEQYIEKSNEEKFIGNIDEARKYLMRALYSLNKDMEMVKLIYAEYMWETRIEEISKEIEKVNSLIKDLHKE